MSKTKSARFTPIYLPAHHQSRFQPRLAFIRLPYPLLSAQIFINLVPQCLIFPIVAFASITYTNITSIENRTLDQRQAIHRTRPTRYFNIAQHIRKKKPNIFTQHPKTSGLACFLTVLVVLYILTAVAVLLGRLNGAWWAKGA